MSERINKTSICSVVFLDIVDYSKMSISDQSDIKEQFNALINEAIKDVAQNDRIILDTGDGAAISLLGAPEEALFVSMTIRDSILAHNKQHSDTQLFVRIGINLGPVRVVSDINGQPNIIGDGINVAQRVMSFAEPNQILVSRSYYEITSRLTKEITGMFTYSGIKHDKHVREHEVYLIRPTDEAPSIEMPAAAIVGDGEAGSAQVAGAQSMSRKGWVILGLLLLGMVAAAAYWTARRPPTHEPPIVMPAIPAPVLPPSEMPAAPEVTPQPAAKTDSNSKKPVEPKRVRAKKTSTAESSNKGAKPSGTAAKADTQPVSSNNASHAPATHKAEHAVAQPTTAEPKAKPDEKSGWDTFRESVKQGGKKECTQGEVALGQCRP